MNTDTGGFRLAHGPAGPSSLMGNMPSGEVSVMLGGSAAFGFGASCDEETIPSHLATGPDAVPWLNLACNGFNSTQELIVFLLHRHQLPVIKDIVVFSGVNTLVLAGLPGADRDYGQFFFSGPFARRLGIPDPAEQPTALTRFARSAGRLVGRGEEKSREARRADPDGVLPPAERLNLALRAAGRDLDRLVELAAPTGARIHYVLQPVSTWTRKPYTTEERVLIEERGEMYKGLFSMILDPAVHDEYAAGMEAVCKDRSIPFLNLNTALGSGPEAKDWLFVDLVHLTDVGYRLSTEVLRAELDLAGASSGPLP
ncbi:IopA [Streptomyces zhaozhouensis]|uniref:IopA n=1 Tax=Streptomyces zhaozhouensis TaxID=1300267 RepID=UPI001BAFF0CB|nr:IopA [Streptomyces zhaozhouensis]